MLYICNIRFKGFIAILSVNKNRILKSRLHYRMCKYIFKVKSFNTGTDEIYSFHPYKILKT